MTRASLPHLALLSSLDESESLHYLNPATCLMVADGEHTVKKKLGLAGSFTKKGRTGHPIDSCLLYFTAV